MSCENSPNGLHLWDKLKKDGSLKRKWKCKRCGKTRSRQKNYHTFKRRDDSQDV